MPTYPDPAVLYPEVVELGSLAAALRVAAARQCLAVPIQEPESPSWYHALVAASVPHRLALDVSASRVEMGLTDLEPVAYGADPPD